MKLEETSAAPPVTDDILREIVRRIREAGDPLRIILFGSHGRGDADPGSDIDILVVEESDIVRWKRSPKYYSATSHTFPARDIVVWTPEEIDSWRAVPNHFITTAVREGKVLYERSG